MPRFLPITRDGLVEQVIQPVLTARSHTVIAVDGADAAQPAALADRIVEALRDAGRSAEVVSLHDYVRPASLRMEFGRTDEMSYRTAWFDYAALRREVVDALRGHGRWLPALWDEAADRSARAAIRTAPPATTIVLAGPMLAGRHLAVDVSLRLDLSEAALRRNTPPDAQWTIPALLRHDAENPYTPDFFVRWDHPDRPALRIDSPAS
ncbi:hypothetical protein IU486_14395 [Streptomyces gardneri]|uniref:hypothetical protein n=1 Tax=Nocardia sputi TaxID=2943705 RepID=UPI001895E28D|nr:hypothetical protein [Nocardia sputi]MBF6165958.1 hypothetical protein [Streptomyces gardneri]MBF6203285.1 hypothetical protein [Streptomyces gardneri]